MERSTTCLVIYIKCRISFNLDIKKNDKITPEKICNGYTYTWESHIPGNHLSAVEIQEKVRTLEM